MSIANIWLNFFKKVSFGKDSKYVNKFHNKWIY